MAIQRRPAAFLAEKSDLLGGSFGYVPEKMRMVQRCGRVRQLIGRGRRRTG